MIAPTRLPPFLSSYSFDVVEEKDGRLRKETMQIDCDVNGEDCRTTVISVEESDKDTETEDEEAKVDSIFYRICYLCMMVGVNFYKTRTWWQKCISACIVSVNVAINIYFVLYVSYKTLSKDFNSNTISTSLGMITYTLQSTFATLFLAYWQSTEEACGMLHELYAAHRGVGIKKFRSHLCRLVFSFYVVIALVFVYNVALIFAENIRVHDAFMDPEITMVFGDPSYFVVFQLANMYCFVCWAVALFVFVLLVQATEYEFRYFNDQVRDLMLDESCKTDEALSNRIVQLIRVHKQLTDCVKRLDFMFHRYAFVMIATIIPTTIFTLVMVLKRQSVGNVLLTLPMVVFCMFSFYALSKSPSKLHDTIYATKSALCSNTRIWFPYRPNVYHSALAFVCHLDQANLGISIWGFAVVSKPLVLTTLSVMATCLALFLQLGECKANAQ